MKIAVLKETKEFEKRVALTPEICKQLISTGFAVTIETDAGLNSYFDNASYEAVGVSISTDKNGLIHQSDIILKVNPLSIDEVKAMRKETVSISMMYAGTNTELVDACVSQGISAFSADAIP